MRCRFQVMNHGDIWLNTGPFWASPSSDILYFLLSSVADDIKVKHFDDFIEFYHEQLTLALKALRYDQHIPTLSELHIDLLDKGGFGKILFNYMIMIT